MNNIMGTSWVLHSLSKRCPPTTGGNHISGGEASGQLENMLERAANNQDNEIARLIETGLSLFEPAIILVMGAMVLFIVLAILLPIFQLDQLTG
jgi:general secretion pathway protein F